MELLILLLFGKRMPHPAERGPRCIVSMRPKNLQKNLSKEIRVPYGRNASSAPSSFPKRRDGTKSPISLLFIAYDCDGGVFPRPKSYMFSWKQRPQMAQDSPSARFHHCTHVGQVYRSPSQQYVLMRLEAAVHLE